MSRTDTIGTHRTTVRGKHGETVVTYHETDVVRFKARPCYYKPDQQSDKLSRCHVPRVDVILDSGGWRTPTTKLRMNQASRQFGLGFHVYQKNFDWFVDLPRQNRTLPFEDGMVFSV